MFGHSPLLTCSLLQLFVYKPSFLSTEGFIFTEAAINKFLSLKQNKKTKTIRGERRASPAPAAWQRREALLGPVAGSPGGAPSGRHGSTALQAPSARASLGSPPCHPFYEPHGSASTTACHSAIWVYLTRFHKQINFVLHKQIKS